MLVGLRMRWPLGTRPIKVLAFKKDETDKMVVRFFQAIKQRRPQQLSFSDLMMFQMTRAVYSKLENMSPYDYQY